MGCLYTHHRLEGNTNRLHSSRVPVMSISTSYPIMATGIGGEFAALMMELVRVPTTETQLTPAENMTLFMDSLDEGDPRDVRKLLDILESLLRPEDPRLSGQLQSENHGPDLVELLLCDRKRPDIVILGEGNFTFSVALAALRKYSQPSPEWNGITATRYEPLPVPPDFQPEGLTKGAELQLVYTATIYAKRFPDDIVQGALQAKPEPQFTEVKLLTVKGCIQNGEHFKDRHDMIKDAVENVMQIQSPPPGTWQYGFDATKVSSDLDKLRRPDRVQCIWFQCPWVPSRGKGHKTFELMKQFFANMVKRQRSGELVLIGIVDHLAYVRNYALPLLLGDPIVNECYHYLGVDRELIKGLLQYGYRHETTDRKTDIHEKILTTHLTLVFKRKKVV